MNTGLVPGTILFAFLCVFDIDLLTLTSSHRVSLLIFAAVGLKERQWRRAQLHQLYFARPLAWLPRLGMELSRQLRMPPRRADPVY